MPVPSNHSWTRSQPTRKRPRPEEEGEEGTVLPGGRTGRRGHRDGGAAAVRDSAVRKSVQGIRRRPAGIHAGGHQPLTFLQHNGIYIAIALGLGVYAFIYFKKRSKAMRELLDRASLKIRHRAHPDKAAIGTLCAHAVDDVLRRRAAGRSAGLGGRRDRQYRVRESGPEDAR